MKKTPKNKLPLPNRKFCTGDKKLVSVRMYEDLFNVLDKIAIKKQWDFTSVVMTALDQYAQENLGKAN